ncbi:hypothetical protein [uncultured Methanobrevibacter sp.]|nr:hypothetical protein [uncultured Methanobrevibacter sp.]
MKRGLRIFSLLLLILLVLCSFTSVFAEDTNNIADGWEKAILMQI